MPRTIVRDSGSTLRFSDAGATTNAVNFAASAAMAAGTLTAYTWAGWIKVRSQGGGGAGRVHDAAPFTILTTTPAARGVKIRAQISHTGTTPTTDTNDLPLGVWMRVLYTWDDAGTVPSVYVGGAVNQSSTTAKTGVRSATLSAQYIGNRSALDRNFDGEIDEVAIWNRVLTAQEIQNDALGYPPPINGLISYKRFDEGSGTTAVDDVIPALNGTISGAAYVTDKISQTRLAASNRIPVQNIRASLALNGISGYVSVPDSPSLALGTNDFYMAGWWRMTDNGAIQMLVAKYSGASFANNASGLGYELLFRGDLASKSLQFRVNDGNVTAGVTATVPLATLAVNMQSWNRICVVAQRSGNASIFVNGVFLGAGVISTRPGTLTNTGALVLGRQSGSGTTAYAKGLVSRFVLADMGTNGISGPVTPAGIALADYLAAPAPTAVVSLALTEGASVTAYDSSGNGNNGSITSALYSLDVPTKRRVEVGANLINNGGFGYAPPVNVPQTATAKFLDGTAGGAVQPNPIDWLGSPDATATIGFDNTVSDTGGYSIKMVAPAGKNVELHKNTGYYSNGYGVIPCLPNTVYIASFRYMVSAASGDSNDGLWMAIYQAQGDGSAGSIANTPKTKVVSAGWQTASVTFTTGPTIRFLHPLIRLIGATGAATLAMTANIDSMTLYPVPNSTRLLVG